MKKTLSIALCLYFITSFSIQAKESTCYGTTKKGRLEKGVQLPSSGANFISYGDIPEIAGRTYVHSTVKKVVVESYQELNKLLPTKVFKYAETGFAEGGKFRPHKTHQNGLSIDFMVPVLNKKNKSDYFPTTALNKYGYSVHFDSEGKNSNFTIDFESLAAHLVALHKAALKNNIEIWRVIFAPDLQGKLYATKMGRYIKDNIMIPTKKSWVRHDEHFHIDFKIKCMKL